MNLTFRAHLLGSAVLIAGVAPLQAQAQSASTPAAEAQSRATVDEVIVTAQRREERMQDVPISVSAVTAEELDRRGLQNSTDLNVAVPALNMTRGIGSVLPFLRGVGNSGTSAGNDPSVAIYVDGVYQSYAPAALFSFNNVDRVEVLKGPQGTLFGRNATGGLINVVTREPTGEFVFRATVGHANYDTNSGNAYIAGGNDKVAVDLAVFSSTQTEGWGRNLFTPTQATPTGTIVNSQGVTVPIPGVGDDVGRSREFAARSKMVIEPSDDTKLTLSADYFRQVGDQGMYRSILPGSVVSPDPTGTVAQQNAARPFRHQGGFYDYNSDVAWTNQTTAYGGSVRLDQAFGAIDFVSLSSYRHSRGYQYVVAEVTPIIGQTNSILNQTVNTFTQEVQLLSRASKPLQWIVGAFYMDSEAAYDPVNFVRGAIEPSFDRYGSQKTRSLSGFGQATYALTDQTNLTAGLRYTSDEIEAEGYDIGRRVGAAPSPTFANGVISQRVAPESRTFDKLTYRLSLDHHFTDDVLGYVSYSRGFKSGIFNTVGLCQSASTTAGLVNTNCLVPAAAVAPEVLDATEVGLKSDLFDRRLRLNVAAFYYDYSNLQVQSVVDNGSGLPIVVSTNAAAAEVYGVDIEGSFVATERLRFAFGASALNAEYADYPNAVTFVPNATAAFPNRPNDSQFVIANAKGNKLNRAPELTASLSATYTIPTSLGDFSVNGTYYYNDGFFWEVGNRLKQPSYSLVNAQIGWRSPDQRYTASVWGRNLGDTEYYAFQQASGTTGDQGAPAAPLTYGISLGVNF